MCPSSGLWGGLLDCDSQFTIPISLSFEGLQLCCGALWACVPLYISLHVHIVPNVLPRSFCSWPRKSLHLLEEGHNHPIVRFAYLCHTIYEEFVGPRSLCWGSTRQEWHCIQCDTYTRMGLRLGASLANFSVVTVWHMIAPRSSWIAPQRIALWLHHAVAFSRMHFPSGFFLFMDLAFSWIWWVCRELARRVGAPSDTPMTNHYSVVVPARCCQSSGRWFDSVCQPSRVARLLWFIWLTVETVNP